MLGGWVSLIGVNNTTMFIFLKYSLKIGKVIQSKENGWVKQMEVSAHKVMILKNNNRHNYKKEKYLTK